MMSRSLLARTVLVLAPLVFGCQSPDSWLHRARAGRPFSKPPRTAQEYHQAALESIRLGRKELAERQLEAALAVDDRLAPAHNNLGCLLLEREEYYLAAWRFQRAAELAPQDAEPLHNLGMVYERAGQPDRAVEWYRKAHDLAPDSVPILASLTGAHVRLGHRDAATRVLLEQLALRAQQGALQAWAREQLAVLKAP